MTWSSPTIYPLSVRTYLACSPAVGGMPFFKPGLRLLRSVFVFAAALEPALVNLLVCVGG